ncbi:hypothetical protein C8J57DRAFT_1373605, partial [Mycena rebaudengoi]
MNSPGVSFSCVSLLRRTPLFFVPSSSLIHPLRSSTSHLRHSVPPSSSHFLFPPSVPHASTGALAPPHPLLLTVFYSLPILPHIPFYPASSPLSSLFSFFVLLPVPLSPTGRRHNFAPAAAGVRDVDADAVSEETARCRHALRGGMSFPHSSLVPIRFLAFFFGPYFAYFF